ncbi:pilus assembly protein PilM, partial [Patescibacteria group bacterium]|nr:pilus assembly protein PilM [Patescibacteria group bacterium]
MSFFKKKSVGLDISDTSLKVLELSGSLEAPKFVSYGRTPLAAGIVKNGEVVDKEKLAEALSKAFSAAIPTSISNKKILFALPEKRVFLEKFSFSQETEDLDVAINERVSERIPI